MKKTVFLASLVAASMAISAQAQILINANTNNGSFETLPGAAGQRNFTPTTSANSPAVPYWGLIAPATNPDTGATPGGLTNQDGANGAFEQPGGSIFNLVTTRPIQLGDVFTISYFGRITTDAGNASSVTLSLYTQTVANSTAPYGYVPANTLGTRTDALTNGFVQYTLTATATAADVGNYVGVSAANSATSNYNGLDNFVLTVTPAPEPSTYAMMFVGLGGLVLVLRARRSVA